MRISIFCLYASLNLEKLAVSSTVETLSDQMLPTVRSDAGSKHKLSHCYPLYEFYGAEVK